ncbi:MAG: DNA polymerase III subunit gamma/tau, partial [Bdellovibrionales bacterium]|nr:DNA polymerase III subunit gamma/tau [Bdellovibrionales bacterium]
EICQADGIQSDEEALWLVARQGDGSMRDSQSLLDQVITFSDGQVTRDKTIEVLGLTDRTLLLETVQALVDRNTGSVVDIIERVFTAGYDPKIFVQDLLEELRHLLLVKITNGQVGSIVDLPDSEVAHLHKLSETLSEEDIHMLFDMALKGGNDLLRAQDTRVVLEMILLRMSSAPRVAQLLNLNLGQATAATPIRPAPVSRPTPTRERAEAPSDTRSAEPPAAQEPAGAAPIQGPTGTSNDRWIDLIKKIKRVNPMVSAKLEHSCLLGIEGKVIRLAVPDKMKFLSGQIEDKEFQKKLLNYVGTFWGPGYQVEVGSGGQETEKKTPKAIEKQRQEDQVRSTREEVEKHPFVQSAQKVFKSQIKAIKETT